MCQPVLDGNTAGGEGMDGDQKRDERNGAKSNEDGHNEALHEHDKGHGEGDNHVQGRGRGAEEGKEKGEGSGSLTHVRITDTEKKGTAATDREWEAK